MQRRAQEVIDRCWAMGDANPILLIHDVGAGGLSNALPEAIAHNHRGGRVALGKNPNPKTEILPLGPGSTASFAALCERERCPFAVVGEITADGRLRVDDPLLSATPVDMPIDVLLGNAPRVTRAVGAIAKQPSLLT